MKISLLLFMIMCSWNVRAQKIDAGFLVKFKDEVTPYRITGVFVVPGEKIKIETLFEDKNASYILKTKDGNTEEVAKNVWSWTAPQLKGVYPITVKESNNLDSIVLNCIVMIPFSELKGESLNGYKIGTYPKSSNKLYNLPKGFIEVTKANEQTLVTPHYKLKDFLCKQAGGYPKYVVLKERGIIKLETVQSQLNAAGIRFDKFSFISGYRTPFYNKSIGNVKNSRHVFGDAYDIYIDANKNGRMDDLNGDGKEDKKDVLFVYNKINDLYKQPWYKPFIGGLGLYGPNSRRTGFIHLDSRGYRARWGQ